MARLATMAAQVSTRETAPDDVSALLRAWTEGDQHALARLTPIVYDELHRLAHYYLKREQARRHAGSRGDASPVGPRGDMGRPDAPRVRGRRAGVPALRRPAPTDRAHRGVGHDATNPAAPWPGLRGADAGAGARPADRRGRPVAVRRTRPRSSSPSARVHPRADPPQRCPGDRREWGPSVVRSSLSSLSWGGPGSDNADSVTPRTR